MRRIILCATLLATASACDDTVFPGGAGGGGGYNADWDGMQLYFDDHCNSCHANGVGTGVFPDDIVAEADPEFDGEPLLLVPFEPELSPLWISLEISEATAEGIDPMPLGRSVPHELSAIQHVKLWILEGAVTE